MNRNKEAVIAVICAVILCVGAALLGIFLPKPDWFPVPLSKAQIIEIIKEYEASK